MPRHDTLRVLGVGYMARGMITNRVIEKYAVKRPTRILFR
jgi:hypothetical protein